MRFRRSRKNDHSSRRCLFILGIFTLLSVAKALRSVRQSNCKSRYHFRTFFALCAPFQSQKVIGRFTKYFVQPVSYFVRFGYNKDEPNLEGRNQIMSITATELKSNLGKYLLLAATEDIFITRNGKVVAKLSNPHQDRVDIAKSLFGILPANVTLEEAKEERLNRI